MLQYIFYFLIYAFLGWCTEVAFAAMKNGQFVNRGFLNGPYCPIYGFGATLVILCLTPLQHNLAWLFFGSCAITTLLEYLTGVALERLFHTRWWDYSEMPFNLHGHVCLLFSVLWGLACTFVMRILHPLISVLYAITPEPILFTSAIVLCSLMLTDTVFTALGAHKFTKHLQRIAEIAEDLREISDELGENIYDAVSALDARADRPKTELQDTLNDIRDKINDAEDALAAKRARYHERREQFSIAMTRNAMERRMLRAFPHMRHTRYQQALERWQSQK